MRTVRLGGNVRREVTRVGIFGRLENFPAPPQSIVVSCFFREWSMWRWVAKEVSEYARAFKDPFYIPVEQCLFSFRTQPDLEQWNVFSDEQYGGSSRADLKLQDRDEVEPAEDGFATFSGECRSEIQEGVVRIKKSGFCGMQSQKHDFLDLADFDHLVFRIRCKHPQDYIAFIKTDNLLSGLQQKRNWHARLPCRSKIWHDVKIPFDDFLLTWKGKVVDDPIRLNRSRVGGVGISIADGLLPENDTKFSLDIAWVKAERRTKE